MDEKLTGVVRKCEELYDISNKKYSDSVWKEILWEQISEELKKLGKFQCYFIAMVDEITARMHKEACRKIFAVRGIHPFPKFWPTRQPWRFMMVVGGGEDLNRLCNSEETGITIMPHLTQK
jgi:hypothetical protein